MRAVLGGEPQEHVICEFEHTEQHASIYIWFGGRKRKKKKPEGLHGGCHAQEVYGTLIGERDESRRDLENFNTGTQSMETIHRAARPSNQAALPADLVQTAELTAGRESALHLRRITAERFGESPDGIPVPVLSVKGLIRCSWFEERNCFCVCTSAYAALAMMSHDAGSH